MLRMSPSGLVKTLISRKALASCVSPGASRWAGSCVLTIHILSAGNQITTLSIPVEGGSDIFAWLIAPLNLYAKHESAFREEPADLTAQPNQRLAFRKLTENPQSRIVIYCECFSPKYIRIHWPDNSQSMESVLNFLLIQ